MVREISQFCEKNKIVALTPDKGKGWVLVTDQHIKNRLSEFINENFVEITAKTESVEGYLTYREGRVRRTIENLRDTKGTKDPSTFSTTITKMELKDANESASRLGHHIPLPKIHKFLWLSEELGDGTPLDTHFSKLHPENGQNENSELIGPQLKFRFVNPLKKSPTAGLGKLVGKILKPIRNSGFRTESIPGYAKKIQSDILEKPLERDEEYTSWDVKSFYDNLDVDFVIKCLAMIWDDFQEKTTRNIDFNALALAIKVCYEDGVHFDNKIYRMKNGGPTGHPVISCNADIVMSAFEKTKISTMMESGLIKLYDRWVDDTFMRHKISDRDQISQILHSFHPKLQFTVETAQTIRRGDQELKFIPVLDIGVLWDPCTGQGHTEVYRKPTTSDIVMPWKDFGPTDWKIGTLIGAIKRAFTHSSDFKIMHTEISRLKSQFRKVGYPIWLIEKKIQQTLAKLLYKANPDYYPNPDAHRKDPEDLPTTWSTLYLPWSGTDAGTIVSKIRRTLPREHSRISIAFTTSKLRDMLPRYSSCKPPENRALISCDIVYKYTCKCGQVYIGETKRRLATRISEHASKKSPRMRHINDCEGAEFDRNLFSIVARGLRGPESRKRYEAIWIRHFDRGAKAINVCESSRELMLF